MKKVDNKIFLFIYLHRVSFILSVIEGIGLQVSGYKLKVNTFSFRFLVSIHSFIARLYLNKPFYRMNKALINLNLDFFVFPN